MAFPGNYNINYYRGDTLEFRVYPKNSAGDPFDLNGYLSSDVKFSIAAEREGDEEDIIEGYTEISEDLTNILCVITPQNGLAMTADVYQYDLEIGKHGPNYDFIYTLLSGTISVADQVTPIRDILPPEEDEEAPGPISDYTVGIITDSSIQLSWTAPTTGGEPTEYKLYILDYNPLYESTEALTALVSSLSSATPITTSNTTYTFTETITTLLGPGAELEPDSPYIFAVVASNETGDSDPVGNFDVVAGTVSETSTYPEVPGPVIDLTPTGYDDTSITIDWSAPITGGDPLNYKLYLLPFLPEYSNPATLLAAIAAALATDPFDTTIETLYTYTGLTPSTPYLVGVVASNISGNGDLEYVGMPITTTPEES